MSVHEDTLQGLRELIEWKKGNLKLRETKVVYSEETGETKFYDSDGNLFKTLKDSPGEANASNYTNALQA